MNDFEGLVAVVTGGSSGIGAATATMLASRGCRVAVLDRQDAPGNGGHYFLECDISDAEVVQSAVATVADHLGRLDILVNNAGVGAQGSVLDSSDAEWRRVLEVNVIGTARVTAAALPYLKESPHASVVTMCSVLAHVGVPARAAYAATKGALVSLTLAMAADHLGDGVRVNGVSPGTADTPWVGQLLAAADDPAAAAEALNRRQPMGRLVTAEEVAFAVCYLASPLASSTTGTILLVDGGMSGIRVST